MGGPITNPFASKPSAPAPQPAPAPVAATTYAPTTSEVSPATATDAAGIKRRRRGRSQTILTGAAGVQEGATLGSPTLLG